MKETAARPESAVRGNTAGELPRRAFWPVLILTALVGLAIRVYVGQKTFIDFDEWQHLFMASSPRWADLAFELRTNAHPPLFFLLLGGIVKLGNVALYRSISIAAGVGSIVVVGLIARKILESSTLALVCAAVFAFSADAILISTEIRSYQLTVFLVLMAFLYWLKVFANSDGIFRARPCVGFAICSSLAVTSHYSAAFFLGACVVVSTPVALRRGLLPKKSIWLPVAALAIPCALFAFEFLVHASAQPIQGYLRDFYLGGTQDETLVSFAIRNFRNFFNLFSPVELRSESSFVFVIALILAASAWILIERRDALRMIRTESSVAIAFAAVMVFELFAASLARKYPFGGMLRHQYIAGPFLLIAAFVVADSLYAIAGTALRRAVPGLLLAACLANLVAAAPALVVYPGLLLLKKEYAAFQSVFPESRAIYLDHWAAIGYFIHTSDRPRRFVRRIPGEAEIDEYHVDGGPPGGVEMFYDKSRNSVDLSDGSVYASFAACLRASGVQELDLFFYSPGDRPVDQTPGKLEQLIAKQAGRRGLLTTMVVVGHTYLLAGYSLAQPGSQ